MVSITRALRRWCTLTEPELRTAANAWYMFAGHLEDPGKHVDRVLRTVAEETP